MTAVTERMGGGSCGLVEQPEPDSDGWLFSGAGCGGGNGSGADCARAAVGDPPPAPAPSAGVSPGTVQLSCTVDTVSGASPRVITITADLSVVPVDARIVAANVAYYVTLGPPFTPFTLTDPGGSVSDNTTLDWSKNGVALLNAAMRNPTWSFQAQLTWDFGGGGLLDLNQMWVTYVSSSGT